MKYKEFIYIFLLQEWIIKKTFYEQNKQKKYARNHYRLTNGKIIAKKMRVTKENCKNKHEMDTKIFWKNNIEYERIRKKLLQCKKNEIINILLFVLRYFVQRYF